MVACVSECEQDSMNFLVSEDFVSFSHTKHVSIVITLLYFINNTLKQGDNVPIHWFYHRTLSLYLYLLSQISPKVRNVLNGMRLFFSK